MILSRIFTVWVDRIVTTLFFELEALLFREQKSESFVEVASGFKNFDNIYLGIQSLPGHPKVSCFSVPFAALAGAQTLRNPITDVVNDVGAWVRFYESGPLPGAILLISVSSLLLHPEKSRHHMVFKPIEVPNGQEQRDTTH